MSNVANLSDSQIANLAHDDAATWIAAMGRTPEFIWDCAETAAAIRGLDSSKGKGELYFHRYVGHMVNVAAGGQGV